MEKFLVRTSSTESLSNKRPAEEDIWRKPKRSICPKKIPSQVTISTENRFSDLQNDSDCSQSDTTFTTKAPSKSKFGRIPPIIMEMKEDWSHVTVKDFVSRFSKDFHLQYKRKGKVAIYCYSKQSHLLVINGLRTENISFHTFTLKEEKKYKVVIRGIPAEAIETLREELNTLGFDATVTLLKGMLLNNNNYCPPILVQLPRGTDIVKFRKIKYLCNCVIHMEKYKPSTNTGTQCYRCQRFGHASKNCNLPGRCVKCTESHVTKDCPKKDRQNPAQCCNCKENHPANFRQCPVRVNYLERLQQKKLQPNIQSKSENYNILQNKSIADKKPVSTTDMRPTSHLSQPTWADVASAKSLKDIQKPIDSARIDTTTSEMLEILSIIKSIKSEFISCNTMLDKVILILTHLGQYV